MNAKLRAPLLLAGCLVGLTSLSSCKPEETEDFGFTCIELNQGESVEDNPFPGTFRIKATMTYEPCLIDYYTKKHPEMRLDGPDDQGPAVFEEWRTRLCTEDIERRVDCEIKDLMSFEQVLSTTGTQPTYQMSIDYQILDSTNLNGRKLLWGPGPVEDAAECDGTQLPFVKLTALSGVIGYDKDDNPLWQVQSFSNNRGLMENSGTGCMQVSVAPI